MNAQFWTLFSILLAAGVLSTLAILPYSLAINPDASQIVKKQLEEKGSRIPPMLVITLASTVQSGILIAIAIFAGLLASRAVGLRLPALEALLAGQPVMPLIAPALPVAVLTGIGAGAIIIALERLYFQPRLPEVFRAVKTNVALWKRALACFYGGIYEELLLRLFVLAGLVWLLGRVWAFPAGQIPPGAFWAASITAALLFGLGHPPATARMAKLTPLLVARALLLNGIAGIFFGVLFLRFGLETAMIAHFFGDIVIHIIFPELTPQAESQPQAQEA